MKLLVCGGAGFIGSTFVRLRVRDSGDEVTVLDKLTYAGRGAGRPNSAVLTRLTAQSVPVRSNAATARSYQEQRPPPATCRTPVRRRSATSTSAGARWPA